MLSSFGIRAYRILIESFLVWAFNNLIFILHTGLGSDTLWRALEVGRMCGLTMCVDAGLPTEELAIFIKFPKRLLCHEC
jgi:hypothetical protein